MSIVAMAIWKGGMAIIQSSVPHREKKAINAYGGTGVLIRFVSVGWQRGTARIQMSLRYHLPRKKKKSWMNGENPII